MRALFATAQQPHSRDIFLCQNILTLNKLINQQEGILPYKAINGTYFIDDILTEWLDYIITNLEMIQIPLFHVAHLPSLVIGEN